MALSWGDCLYRGHCTTCSVARRSSGSISGILDWWVETWFLPGVPQPALEPNVATDISGGVVLFYSVIATPM